MNRKKEALVGGDQTQGHLEDSDTIIPCKPVFVDPKTISLEDARRIVASLKRFCFNRTDQVPVKTEKGYQTRAVPSDLDQLLLGHIVGRRTDPTTVRCWSSKQKNYWSEFGHFRCGTYLPSKDGKSKFGVIDIDGGFLHKFPVQNAESIAIAIALNYHKSGFKPYIESSASASGYHVWVFFDPPADAVAIRALAFSMIPKNIPLLNGGFADPHASRGVEVFPKQDRVCADGFGSVMWLPFWCGSKPRGNQFFHLSKERL